jgi:hypothetical protein
MTVVGGMCRTRLDHTAIHLADTDAEAGSRSCSGGRYPPAGIPILGSKVKTVCRIESQLMKLDRVMVIGKAMSG